jgi:hypothetical protein
MFHHLPGIMCYPASAVNASVWARWWANAVDTNLRPRPRFAVFSMWDVMQGVTGAVRIRASIRRLM